MQRLFLRVAAEVDNSFGMMGSCIFHVQVATAHLRLLYRLGLLSPAITDHTSRALQSLSMNVVKAAGLAV